MQTAEARQAAPDMEFPARGPPLVLHLAPKNLSGLQKEEQEAQM